MARITHATQIDLRFGDSACELLQFGISVCPSNLAGKCFDLFRPGWIGTNRKALGRNQPDTLLAGDAFGPWIG